MQTATLTLPKETSWILTELTGEPRFDVALTLIIRDCFHYKLAQIETSLKHYEQKYKSSFEAYKQIWDTADCEDHYSYEAEQDYLEWEALITRRRRLNDRLAWLP